VDREGCDDSNSLSLPVAIRVDGNTWTMHLAAVMRSDEQVVVQVVLQGVASCSVTVLCGQQFVPGVTAYQIIEHIARWLLVRGDQRRTTLALAA